ncbi:YDG domain-containing protein, partial [Agathobaculum sp.]|uniref:YDG domain-containing protein n=1 Tax=Agathobaculum sp. TaxID=2048138 RepID=UPI003A8D70C2
MKKRVLSLFMVLVLCLTLLPTPAWAAEADAPEGGAPAADEQPAVQSEPAPQAAVQEAEVPAENAVAQVGNVNYANITDAFAAVKGNGGTLTLLANCRTPNTNEPFDISGNYTLDLNGCMLTGRLYLSETSTSLTVKDSGTNGKIQATGSWSPLWVYGGDVTIESGTLATQNENAQALVFGDNDACKTLTITGGSFETGYVNIGASGGKTVISGGAFHELRVNGDYSKRVTLSGGTFDTVKRRKSGSTIAPTDLLADGYTFVDRDTDAEVSTSQEAALTNVKVVSKETANASASLTVDGTETPYGTFEEALTAAQQTQGGTLTLLNNVNLVTQVYVNSSMFTLDLNGHTLTSGDYNTLVVGDGSVTIQDSKVGGVISNTRSDGIAVYCYGGNVTILGGSFPSKLHWESGTVSLQGGAFRSLDSKAGSWLSAIPEGKALKKDDDSVVDASAKTIIAPTGFYVLADHEKHDWQAGKCACGREHTDHKWKDGECTVCHLPCSHGEISGDGVCKTCGTQFTAKANGDYYKHLSDALASESVDDVTLVADDTLSTDVTLIQDIFFYPNGHTVSGGGSIVVPSGKTLVLNKTGNAGAIRVENGGTLMVDEDFTGTVQTLTVSETAEVRLLGGTYGTITGSREKAGTLLYDGDNRALAFKKQDGSFARYDQRISSKTPLENVTVDFCRHEQLTEACDGACEYCNGALRCRIGAAGYRDMSDAIRDVPDGGTITLLRDYSAVTNISANVDRAYTIDLNGHSVRKNNGGISLAVYAGTPKIIDSKGGGVIAGLEIDSSLDLTLADLLPKGWDFQKSDGIWLSTTELKGKTASNVTVAQLPIQSMKYPTEMSMTYGGTGTLIVNVKGTGAVTFQWYKVEDGNEKAVGSETTKNQFDFSALKLPAGKHIFRFSATCNGYKKMSQDIVITVQKADIRSGLITPPTAQENLTYTGQAQALITAGSVTSGGTMQYSLTKNGTYSQDIPTGTDAGAYTVWYRVIGDANHTDTAPASVAVRIGKKPLTITGVTAASKPYDGTTNADISGVTFNGVNLNRGTDYTVTASFDDAGVGSGKNITATVTLMGQAAKNYALEQSSFPTTGSITKAAAPDFTKETALVIINGHEKTYTVTLPALPTLKTPKEYGALTYEIGEIKLNGGYYTSGAKVENGKLTLPIQKNDVETTGSVGTVTVVIKSANYEDITLTVNIFAKNKLTPVMDGKITASKITYGQALSDSSITGKMKGPNTGDEVNGTFTWTDGAVKPDANDRYEAEWTFTPDSEEYATVTDTATVEVAPKSIEGAVITLESADLEYNAAEQSPKITGVALEKWTENITYRIVSGNTATNVNDSLTLTIEGTGNYTGKAAVKWKITPREVTPAIEVASCTYTGDALEPTVTLKDGNEVIPTDEYTVEYSNNTNAGTGRVTIKDVAGGNYVIKEKTQDFTITKAAAPTNIQSGTLTITNGLHKTYSFDLSTLLPKLTAPCDYGTITYDKKVDTNLGVGSFITLVNGKTGELTLEANRSGTDEGQFGAITVTISTSNYQDITLTVNVIAKNRITPTGTPTLSKNAITYGDALNTIALSGKLHDNVNNVDVDGTFEWVDGTHIPVVGNGTYAAE